MYFASGDTYFSKLDFFTKNTIKRAKVDLKHKRGWSFYLFFLDRVSDKQYSNPVTSIEKNKINFTTFLLC